MPFQLLPADLTDLPDLVAVFQAAFRDDPIIYHLMRDVDPEVKYKYDMGFLGKYIRDGPLTGSRFFKIVEEGTRKVVAFAKWQYSYTLTPEQKQEKEEYYSKRAPYPEGTNEVLYKDFFGQLDTLREKYVDEEEEYFLHILCVLPGYQRQGLGSMLIREGLEAADRDHARTYIEASPFGLGLYKKFGWKEVDAIRIDMRPHGGQGIVEEMTLIREPGAGMA